MAKNPRAGEEKTDWEWGGFRGPGHGVPFYDEQSGKYYFVHHVRDGAEINRVYDEKEDRNSYQVHYMMIRPMFFVNDWPAFGAEPYQGENFEPNPGFHEGCAWNYTFYVPHDVKGLARLMGGKKPFVDKLQRVFDERLYDPANEPDIAYAHLFSYFKGEEWRTQKELHRLLQKYFKNAPDGNSRQ